VGALLIWGRARSENGPAGPNLETGLGWARCGMARCGWVGTLHRFFGKNQPAAGSRGGFFAVGDGAL
jgi:hypothetical protein